jgi:ABC-2 type transport system permease protein
MSENIEASRSRLHGLWALTNRDLKKWYQSPIVFVISMIQPVIWMGLLGKAMNLGALIPSNSGVDPTIVLQQTLGTPNYFSFMAMGMIAFTTVFTSAFIGMSVVWDRRLGFLNKVVSTPVYRSVIILSKVLSATLRSMFQAAIVTVVALIFGLTLGANFTPLSILGLFGIVFLIGMGLASLFTVLTLRSTRMETPQAIFNLISLPLIFASSGFFPIAFMPSWLQALAKLNPVSYTTDAVRRLTVFSNGYGQLPFDFAYVGIFAIVVTAISIVVAWKLLGK